MMPSTKRYAVRWGGDEKSWKVQEDFTNSRWPCFENYWHAYALWCEIRHLDWRNGYDYVKARYR